jgi:hypothetical protein
MNDPLSMSLHHGDPLSILLSVTFFLGLLYNTFIGMVIFLWFLSQCNDCETKEEYDRSHKDLSKFLNRKATRSALSRDCILAIRSLQAKLKSKEFKLAGYLRMDIKDCLDAMTTSPVEGNNRVVKHGTSKISSTMNLDKAAKKLLIGINTRLRLRRNKAKRELTKTNKSSRAPTKEYLILKGQGLIDRHYDERHNLQSAQLDVDRWIVWDFDDKVEEELKDNLHVYRPRFMRVRELTVKVIDEKNFVSCECKKRIRIGLPCSCFFRIADNGFIDENEIMDVGMVDVRYLKTFNAHYGDEGALGDLLYAAQEECFRYEGLGTS